MFTDQACTRVVRPDECLSAADVIEPVRTIDRIPEGLQIRTVGELMESDLIADSPVGDDKSIVGVPQHRLAHTVVEPAHAVFSLDDRRIGAPGHTVDGMLHCHVGREDPVVFPGTLQVHVSPEVQQDRPMQRDGRSLQQRRRGLHTVVHRLFESVHRAPLGCTGCEYKRGKNRQATRAPLVSEEVARPPPPEAHAPAAAPVTEPARG